MSAPIDLKKWRSTPAVYGRTATEADVNEGSAVFAVGGEPVELDRRPARSSGKKAWESRRR